MASVGKAIPHDSAVGHVTGAALYIDDLPARRDELLIGLVGSPVASGRVTSIGVEEAKSVPGVAAILTAGDIPGERLIGPLIRDEPVLADAELQYVGQPVALIAAESEAALTEARRRVQVDLVETDPVLTIDRAIELERFIGPPRQIARGDADAALRAAPHRLSGVFHNLGQEQFYLESQAALAYPGEEGQIVVHSSTQSTTEIQHVVSEALGVGMHEVVCVCQRMGGAFGGKETQAALPAIFAALAAAKTGRSCRLAYSKDDDMRITGKRHRYRTEWEVGFGDDGRISAYRVNFYSDGGASADLSTSVMERSMLHAENGYFIPDIEINGRVCRTNYPPNTAFRGFGGPQGMACIESVTQAIAEYLSPAPAARHTTDSAASNGHNKNGHALNGHAPPRVDALTVRQRNLYGVGQRDVTPYGQTFIKNHLPEITESLAKRCSYRERLAEIERTNRSDPLWFRGLALTPVKFGISFTTKFLNQANALVNVYTDGSVQVSTGGTEMGQGLNTKIRQLVADEFALGVGRVRVMPTSTEKSNNTSPTAASAGTDLNGAAALDACRQIKDRLASYAARLFASTELGLTESPAHVAFDEGWAFDRRNGDQRIEFGDLCDRARRDRIDLGARGFFATPGVDYNRETGRGAPFFYYTQGAAAAEVRIDRFTGELTVTRADVLIDIGKSINPGVDRGQVVGGFIQGMGWVTGECLVYDDRGVLLSHSPTTYKIPAVTDVPRVFNCEMFPNDDNTQNIRRSKAVGEPPLMHAISVWCAARHALSCVSHEASRALTLPATGEELLRCLTLADASRAAAGVAEGATT
ncbi:MAG: molybdopterin cofactor-binding domain-containing protein [Planctomycetota bacterium]